MTDIKFMLNIIAWKYVFICKEMSSGLFKKLPTN